MTYDNAKHERGIRMDRASRPIGTELEFANSECLTYRDSGIIGIDEWAPMADEKLRTITRRYLPDYLKRTGNNESNRQYASDGGRYYVDHRHFEVARPLAGSLREAVTQFIAGQEIAYEAFSRAKEAGAIGAFAIGTRLLDTRGNSWGYHENYLMNRQAIIAASDDEKKKNVVDWKIFRSLAYRLATSPLSGGAGCIYRGQYWYAQKALTLGGEDFASHTTSRGDIASKPLVNTRDRPLADLNEYFRAHIVSRDALSNPKAMFRELGATSLVLSTIEEHIPVPDMRIRDGTYNQVAQLVAGDMAMSQLVELHSSGAMVHPLDIEEELIMAAGVLRDRQLISDEEVMALGMWEDVHDRLRRVRRAGMFQKNEAQRIEAVQATACELLDDVAWAQRLRVLRTDFARNRQQYGPGDGTVPYDHPRARRLDQAFDRVDDPRNPKGSISMKLRLQPSAAEFMPTRTEIDAAKRGQQLSLPREAQRAEFIRTFPNDYAASVAWESVRHENRTYPLKDPRQRNEDLQQFMEENAHLGLVTRPLLL